MPNANYQYDNVSSDPGLTNGRGVYVTETMFIATTDRLEGKIDGVAKELSGQLADLSKQVSLALPRLEATEKTDEEQGKRALRSSDRKWAAKLVVISNVTAAVLGTMTAIAIKLI